MGAGAVCQTVWNIKHQYKPDDHLKDIDLIYYDASDISSESELEVRCLTANLFGDLQHPIDVVNQARVHTWYSRQFGFEIPPYQSSQEAIGTWPTTASSIGVRLEQSGEFTVFAPFGLSDIDAMIVRPNKRLINKEIYESKALQWKRNWPKLEIVPWSG